MNKFLLPLIALLTAISCETASPRSHTVQVRECPAVTVRFSPKGGVTQSIVEGIKASEHTVHVQAFSFTSAPIAEALVEAKQRGVNVLVLLDKENLHNRNSVLQYLHNSNVPVYIDDRHAIAHNKILIIDKAFVFTGSFNLSRNAEEFNAENSITIHDSKIAELYFENWSAHKEHSYLYSADN